MALPLYLAMTAAEMRGNAALPSKLAYMACHFSPYETGLSNCPKTLPEGAMLILNDRTPIHGHEHELIAAQLMELVEKWKCSSVLLDFQRAEAEETAKLAKVIVDTLPYPVGVSESYADKLPCPVFLPAVPPDTPLKDYLRPWQGREIWLEAALDGIEIALTEQGAASVPLPFCKALPNTHWDEVLHCHYHIHTEESQARFTLYRTHEDVDAILEEAAGMGVSLAVGLWQELN